MSRRQYTPPTPPSEEYEMDQNEMQRQWLMENHPNHNNDFIFMTPETYQQEQEQLQRIPPPAGIAFHVHNVFDNIKENAYEIMDTLGGPHSDLFIFQIGAEELLMGFHETCIRILERHYTSPKLEVELDKLSQILNKLNLVSQEFLSNENISNIFTAIHFVKRQPDVFQKYYVDLFIQDTFYAYNGVKDTISCPRGIVERTFFAIADACLIYCTSWKKRRKQKKKTKKNTHVTNTTRGGGRKTDISQYKRCDNPIYRKLIRLFKKEVPDLNELSKEWGVLFEDTEEIAKMSAEELKKNFIDFMTRKYKLYGITQIDNIIQRADHYEEEGVFTRKEFG